MSNLYHKYNVTKADESPVDSGAQYFVLRIDTDVHARQALRLYADCIEEDDPAFAVQLRDWVAEYSDADPKPRILRMSEIGKIDFTALEQQAASLGHVIDSMRLVNPRSKTTNDLEAVWNLCHALLDWKEKH